MKHCLCQHETCCDIVVLWLQEDVRVVESIYMKPVKWEGKT
jgi:hypothetical protein